MDIIRFIDGLPKDKTCEIMGMQILRSATSIGANVIEAEAASSRKDYTNFFSYSLKSANETKFWLELFRDAGKTQQDMVNNLLKEVREIANILASSILTLRGKK